MRPFEFERASDNQSAIATFNDLRSADIDAVNAQIQYLAGGTTLIDLMKLDVMKPTKVIDINALQQANGNIEFKNNGLRLGAMARMSQVADHADIQQNYPVIAQALRLAASAQIRNMAAIGGNVLQRTRCTYFRDTSYANCNKRAPGSGCAALEGVNRSHAVLGVSDQCIATYPGDFAQALMALDAQVELDGPRGKRTIPFASLHKKPDQTPNIETSLTPGELITAFNVAAAPYAKRSLFLKVRDRESYEFALASAAVALDLDNSNVRQARIALGGVATVPWRAKEAEAALAGNKIDDVTAKRAADAAFADAKPREHNAFKIELGKRTLTRALLQAAAMEVPT
ncbi:MAG: xanthine dehydrogenase family protein subunit M [Pseudolabrys sp.]|nr:xanthine dehydrogenase family protein subunit M [Pseudolabrys sp.]MBV9259834.1 xanthine dehydrogenase family protein subunit M [Pseudolabrys sp.]